MEKCIGTIGSITSHDTTEFPTRSFYFPFPIDKPSLILVMWWANKVHRQTARNTPSLTKYLTETNCLASLHFVSMFFESRGTFCGTTCIINVGIRETPIDQSNRVIMTEKQMLYFSFLLSIFSSCNIHRGLLGNCLFRRKPHTQTAPNSNRSLWQLSYRRACIVVNTNGHRHILPAAVFSYWPTNKMGFLGMQYRSGQAASTTTVAINWNKAMREKCQVTQIKESIRRESAKPGEKIHVLTGITRNPFWHLARC